MAYGAAKLDNSCTVKVAVALCRPRRLGRPPARGRHRSLPPPTSPTRSSPSPSPTPRPPTKTPARWPRPTSSSSASRWARSPASRAPASTSAVAAGTGFSRLARRHRRLLPAADTDYLHLTGGQFACHTPRSAGRPSSPTGSEITGEDHPITAGIADFDLLTEQYWVLTDPYSTVLATTTHVAAGALEAAASRSRPCGPREWGEGRVFVATPGHDLRHPQERQRPHHSSRGAWHGRAGEDRDDRLREGVHPVHDHPSGPFRAWSCTPSRTSTRTAPRPPRPKPAPARWPSTTSSTPATWCSTCTVPAAHTEVALRAIAAGKDVYGEKPLAATLAEATAMVEAAHAVKLGLRPRHRAGHRLPDRPPPPRRAVSSAAWPPPSRP